MSVLEQLKKHPPADADEARHRLRILEFLARHANPFDRGIAEGHLTGSAFVVSEDGQRLLLLRHRKLARWLQPGGHADPGELTGAAVALREAREETGLSALELHPTAPRPLDVDVHEIPAHGTDAAHQHLDLRYLVVARGGSAIRRAEDESDDLRWFRWAELGGLDLDPGIVRALAKVRPLVGQAR